MTRGKCDDPGRCDDDAAPFRQEVPVKTPLAWRFGRALAALALIGAGTTTAQAAAATPALQSIVPAPVSVTPSAGVVFPVVSTTKIVTEAGSAPAKQVGDYLAGVLRPSTGYALP